MTKNKLIDFLIIVLIYIAFCVFPYERIIKNLPFWAIFARFLSIFVAIIIILVFSKTKSTIHMADREKHFKRLPLFIPGLVICGSNMFYFIFYPNSFKFTYDNIFLLQIGIQLLTAVIEEYIFRALLHDNLKIENTLLRIVVASFTFGCFHFIVFFSTFNPVDLIVPLYTFGLGVVLGLMYEYVGCLIAPMVFHFLFNLVNSVLFAYSIEKVNFLPFVLINVVISLIFVIYFIIIYLFVLKRKNVDIINNNQ